jgi:hypothetical protein
MSYDARRICSPKSSDGTREPWLNLTGFAVPQLIVPDAIPLAAPEGLFSKTEKVRLPVCVTVIWISWLSTVFLYLRHNDSGIELITPTIEDALALPV